MGNLPRTCRKGVSFVRWPLRAPTLLLLIALLTACSPAGAPTDSVSPAAPEPQAEAPPPSEPEPAPELRLAFVGDILLGAGLEPVLQQHGPDWPWLHAAPILKRADFAMGNLETAVSSGGTPAPDKQFLFRSRPEVLIGAARAGIDVLGLANNHTLDYGAEALIDTINHVRTAYIHPVGAGKDAARAFTPVILEAKGLKVAVFGFTRVIPVGEWAAGEQHPGLAAGYDPAPVLQALDAIRGQVDIIVVQFHWGEELKEAPRQTDIDLAQELLAHGATIVIGHHPHVLQGIDLRDGRLVAYSLGNFIFTSVERRLNQETGILEVTVGREGVTGAHFTPMYITGGQPRPLDGAAADAVLERLGGLSRQWNTCLEDGRVRAACVK